MIPSITAEKVLFLLSTWDFWPGRTSALHPAGFLWNEMGQQHAGSQQATEPKNHTPDECLAGVVSGQSVVFDHHWA